MNDDTFLIDNFRELQDTANSIPDEMQEFLDNISNFKEYEAWWKYFSNDTLTENEAAIINNSSGLQLLRQIDTINLNSNEEFIKHHESDISSVNKVTTPSNNGGLQPSREGNKLSDELIKCLENDISSIYEAAITNNDNNLQPPTQKTTSQIEESQKYLENSIWAVNEGAIANNGSDSQPSVQTPLCHYEANEELVTVKNDKSFVNEAAIANNSSGLQPLPKQSFVEPKQVPISQSKPNTNGVHMPRFITVPGDNNNQMPSKFKPKQNLLKKAIFKNYQVKKRSVPITALQTELANEIQGSVEPELTNYPSGSSSNASTNMLSQNYHQPASQRQFRLPNILRRRQPSILKGHQGQLPQNKQVIVLQDLRIQNSSQSTKMPTRKPVVSQICRGQQLVVNQGQQKILSQLQISQQPATQEYQVPLSNLNQPLVWQADHPLVPQVDQPIILQAEHSLMHQFSQPLLLPDNQLPLSETNACPILQVDETNISPMFQLLAELRPIGTDTRGDHFLFHDKKGPKVTRISNTKDRNICAADRVCTVTVTDPTENENSDVRVTVSCRKQ